MHNQAVDVFTVCEVATLLRAVDGREAFTARAIRYYARAGVLEPSGRAPGPRGARLYTVVDVALLRLLWLLQRKWQLSERVAWALYVYRLGELRSRLDAGEGVIEIPESAAVSRGAEDCRSIPWPIRVPVASIVSGLAFAARRLRRRRPRVWTGTAWQSATDAAALVRA